MLTMSTNDRPSKRARIAVEEGGSCVEEDTSMDDLALTFSSVLGLGGAGEAEAAATGEEEVPDLLIKTLTFLAESTELVRSRAVCRVFRRWSDSIAKDETAKLIGPSIHALVGQSVTALLHGAEKASEETREMLKGWNAEASRAKGFDVGLPTFARRCSPRGDIQALIPVGNLAPGIRVPVGLKIGDHRDDPDENGEQARGTRVDLPSGFFHFNLYGGGMLHLCHRQRSVCEERTLDETLRRAQHDLSNPDWECPHTPLPLRLTGFGPDQNRELYNEYLARCCQTFSNYELGQSLPSGYKDFCDEIQSKSKQIEEEQKRGAAQDG